MAIETVNPANGERVKRFDALSTAEIERRVALAQTAFQSWSRRPIAARAQVVARAGELLEQRKDDYGRLMTLEMGKLLGAAHEEAVKCAGGCRYFAEHGPAMLADEPVSSDGDRGSIAFHPLGCVLAVMPWNFPFWQVIRFAAPALVAGNVGLLKHASNVPQCALALEQLFRDAGAPEGVFQTLLIGSSAVAPIIADERVAAVTLTGSTAAGREVASIAGRHIKKTVLELGGSDPFVVMPSANLEAAVETAVRARIINNGQSCIAAKRFIVHEKIAGEFEQRFVRAMQSLRVGSPLDPATQVGPLATRQLVDDLEKQVNEAVRLGAHILAGGKRVRGQGFFFEPTVLASIPRNSPAYRDELFGPVASLFQARDAADAIRIANDTHFGLAASAWTTDAREIEHFARELEAGTVFVNGMVASDVRFPFGGIKSSGYGRELSAFGIREFVNIKTVRVCGPGGSAQQSSSHLTE